MKIEIRPMKDDDLVFVLASWIKSSYSSITGYRERYGTYHKHMEAIIRARIKSGDFLVYVACLDSDPDFILGYACFGNEYTLHYAFTKQAFKKLGVCKKLLEGFYKSKKEIVVSFWCSDINYIKKMFHVEYNRFKFFMES